MWRASYSSKLPVFVADRVSEILESTTIADGSMFSVAKTQQIPALVE